MGVGRCGADWRDLCYRAALVPGCWLHLCTLVELLHPERGELHEPERTAREQRPSAALDAAIAEAERAQTQQIELERLRGIVTGVPIDELPFLFAAELGVEQLRRIASVLS